MIKEEVVKSIESLLSSIEEKQKLLETLVNNDIFLSGMFQGMSSRIDELEERISKLENK
jgi:polyhydroxyalkanoate synthesis regulator phasin